MGKYISHSQQVFNMGPNSCTPSRSPVEKRENICNYAGFTGEGREGRRRAHDKPFTPSLKVSPELTPLSLFIGSFFIGIEKCGIKG